MNTFEIQVYKSGTWHVDSYYDDRDMALSAAERLTDSDKDAGVRVLEDDYDETSSVSSCRVVFSQSLKSNNSHDRRKEAKRASKSRSNASKMTDARSTRGPAPHKGSNTSFYLGLVVGFVVLIAGVAATIGLQEIARYL